MHLIDILSLASFCWGAYKGYKKGLLMELVGLLALVGGILTGIFFEDQAVQLLKQHISVSDTLMPILAFISVFLCVLVGFFLVGKITKKIMDYTLLGDADKWLGAGVGILKFALISSFLIWVFAQAGVDIKGQSILYPYLEPIAPFIIQWVQETDFDALKDQIPDDLINTDSLGVE